MIVEPLPTNPPGRGRSALRVLAIALPALLLLVVAGVGVLGPAAPGQPPRPSAGADASAVPGTTDDPGGSPAAEPPEVAVAPFPRHPAAIANMRVRSLGDTLAAHTDGHGADTVAIAGYLRAWTGPACAVTVTGLVAVGCPMDAIIAEAGRRDPTSGFGGLGAHIHAVVAPGVQVPAGAVRERRDSADLLPVVVIGRFPASDTGCTGDLRECEEPFAIERVAWASGERLALGHLIADGLRPEPGDPIVADRAATAARALGPITTLLRAVYVEAGDVGALDPVAGAVIGSRDVEPATPVWYLRGLDVPYDPLLDPPYGKRAPLVRWAVLDPATGEVLARGSLGEDPQSAL